MTRGKQTKWLVVGALALALLAIVLYPRREPAEQTENALRPPVSTLDPPAGASSTASTGGGSSATSPASVAKGAQRPLDARAAARRQRVLDALAHGAAAKPGAAQNAAAAQNTNSVPGTAQSSPRVYKEGTMADKTGDFGDEVRVLNRDFIPLVEECYDQAREHDARIGGMLALNVSFAHAEGVGGIIESVEEGPGNQVKNPELLECVRQSAFSVELPEPKSDGRNKRFLTIPFGPLPADAGTTPPP